eukprot:CAMPEP_0194479742 /NCGR_PEP_ID=MMETSP0253-20130528/2766_1 /TAXON_ID=2966 /ORGANISM="Noctiluca scintillans" /LENGTH=688 /DNA_ID=CAMNT_0039319017 /DNA_START=65 /DNA_END=2131 /DNA_ORIENTATION=-
MKRAAVSAVVPLFVLAGAADPWWFHSASFRTVSPWCSNLTTADLLNLVDELSSNGVKVLSIVAAYDSGYDYDPFNLWCGLGMSDPVAVNQRIGSEADWTSIVDKAHSLNMKVMTWLNPSYFWTGSASFKAAEADVAQYGLDSLPDTSPANWFRWSAPSAHASNPLMPADDDVHIWGSLGYRFSPKANANYLSYWGGQPSVDYTSPSWRAKIKEILEHWIDLGVDAFMLDYPDGYIGAGSDNSGFWDYTPDLLKSAISNVVHSYGQGRVGVFAEIYISPQRTNEYGFNGSIGDIWDQSYAQIVANAIGSASNSDLDSAFSSGGGVDTSVATCYHSSGESCPIVWENLVLFNSWFPGAATLGGYLCSKGQGAQYEASVSGTMRVEACFAACAEDASCDGVTVGWEAGSASTGERTVSCTKIGGVDLSACEPLDDPRWYLNSSHGPSSSSFEKSAVQKTTLSLAINLAGGLQAGIQQSGNGAWFRDVAWPGSANAPALPSLLSAVEQSSPFSLVALRSTLATTQSSHYAMLRYSALSDGSAGVAAFNLASTAGVVEVSLPSSFASAAATNILTGETLQVQQGVLQVQLPAYGYAFFELPSLPTWAPDGPLDCTGRGVSSYKSKIRSVPFAQCLLSCLEDSQCTSTSLDWDDPGNDASVTCYLLGGVDLSACTTSTDGYFTTQHKVSSTVLV